jgi:hypothetical protein
MQIPSVVAAGIERAWVRGVLWVAAIWVVTAAVWWLTVADALYGAVVATVALGAVGDGAVSAGRSLTGLALAVAVVTVGAITLGEAGVGLSTEQRVLQGSGGVAAAALVLIAKSLVRRRGGRSDRP